MLCLSDKVSKSNKRWIHFWTILLSKIHDVKAVLATFTWQPIGTAFHEQHLLGSLLRRGGCTAVSLLPSGLLSSLSFFTSGSNFKNSLHRAAARWCIRGHRGFPLRETETRLNWAQEVILILVVIICLQSCVACKKLVAWGTTQIWGQRKLWCLSLVSWILT